MPNSVLLVRSIKRLNLPIYERRTLVHPISDDPVDGHLMAQDLLVFSGVGPSKEVDGLCSELEDGIHLILEGSLQQHGGGTGLFVRPHATIVGLESIQQGT